MKQKLLLATMALTATILYGQTKIESSVIQNYNGSTYINSQSSNYTYDANGNLSTETFFTWDGTKWVENFKLLYTYNANNKATQELEQQWDGSQYVDEYQRVYTYNSNGMLSEILDQNWIGNQWENEYQTTISYNGNQLFEAITRKWNGTQWVNDYKSTLTYTGNNLTQILNKDWDGTQYTDVGSDREVFTYNANGKKTLNVVEKRNGTQWVEEERITYVLDANENRISETGFYNGSNQYKDEYLYDTSVMLSSFMHPFKDKTGVDYIYEDFPYVNKIIEKTEFFYNTTTNTFDIRGRTIYDYNNQIALGTENVEAGNTLKVYPNPTHGRIKINGLKTSTMVKIYNVLGKIVMQQHVGPYQNIDLGSLTNGMYFLKPENKGAITIIKN